MRIVLAVVGRLKQGPERELAERLGISRRQLFDKIREYDLQP